MPGHVLLLLELMIAAVPAGWVSMRAVTRLVGEGSEVAVFVGFDIMIVYWAWTTAAGMPLLFCASCALGWALAAITACEVLALRMPGVLVWPLAAAGLVLSPWFADADPLAHVIGAAANFALFAAAAWLARRAGRRKVMRLDAATLAGAAGAWLGWHQTIWVATGTLAGMLLWLGVLYAINPKGGRVVAGVPLVFAFWLLWLYGPLVRAV